MQLVNHNGRAYYVPASELDRAEINSLFRWEQAFWVFSDIFTQRFPQKSAKLIQYNHVIHTAVATAAWENVAAYDCEFRKHMARHPLRSWGIILQQAWTVNIKDKSAPGNKPMDIRSNTPAKKKVELCWRFNRGKCSYGMNCKFNHRCGVCSKFGHGAHSCHKLGHSSDRYYAGPSNRTDRDNRGQPARGERNDRFHFFSPNKKQGGKRDNSPKK